jgi:hypothetical protein
MKSHKLQASRGAIALAALVVCSLGVPESASALTGYTTVARSGSHGGGSRGGYSGGSRGARSGAPRSGHGSGQRPYHSHSHSSSGFYFGAPVLWGGYYYPPVYAFPGAAAPPPEYGYIEKGEDAYYCPDSGQYYPQADECSGGWMLVTPRPVPPS